ncbi:hypothetical protein LCGC14_1048180 [marine sediment metagenome]|uniref:Uncharacterized protein n=1 Tax=marine sediment metagenome TaxID=412755 RepID=A0A0F9NBI7_9ZZZZ
MPYVNPTWLKQEMDKLRAGTFTETSPTSFNKAIQLLLRDAAIESFHLKVVQLGAGVKKLVLADKICEHCKGKGYLS